MSFGKDNFILRVDFTEADYLQIAKLHQLALPYGFLATVPVGLLALIYRGLDSSPGSFIIAATKSEGKIVGFISGSLSLRQALKTITLSRPTTLVSRMLPILASPRKLGKLAELFFYSLSPKRVAGELDSDVAVPDFELLSLAVSTDCQGQGIGNLLYAEFIEELKRREIHAFKIIVGQELSNAHIFYNKMGAVCVGQIELHKGDFSCLYTHYIN